MSTHAADRQRGGAAHSAPGCGPDGRAPLPPTCDPVAGPVDIDPPKGAVYRFISPLLITPLRGTAPHSKPVPFSPVNGQQLTIELAGMHLRVSASALGGLVTLCRQP